MKTCACSFRLGSSARTQLLWTCSPLASQNLTLVNSTNFRGTTNLKEKQLHMAGYLFELCYDLTLSAAEDLSQSPGFETCGLKTFK